MRVLIDSLKRLYAAGRLTKEQIAVRVEKGTIDEAEYEEITGEKYKAETKAKYLPMYPRTWEQVLP